MPKKDRGSPHIQERLVLSTERLRLRLPEASDIPAILAYYRENAAHFAPTDPPRPADFLSKEFWVERIRSIHEQRETEQSLSLFLFPPGAHELIGTISFSQMCRGPFQACYLGYGIAQRHQGKGMMAEALMRAIAHIFTEMNFHRIMANHLPENHRSAAALQRLGFVKEGLAKDYLFINGQWRDHVLNSLTNPHWKNDE
jgi:ribosomal-protein-alanine N-acetyltransferase